MDYFVRYFSIDYKKTGRKLDELMKAKCVDVRTLSNTIGVSNQSVYKWIHGQTLPTLDNMYQISKLFRKNAYKQVVGHTPVEKISEKDGFISTDVFSTYSDGHQIGESVMIVIDTESGKSEIPT